MSKELDLAAPLAEAVRQALGALAAFSGQPARLLDGQVTGSREALQAPALDQVIGPAVRVGPPLEGQSLVLLHPDDAQQLCHWLLRQELELSTALARSALQEAGNLLVSNLLSQLGAPVDEQLPGVPRVVQGRASEILGSLRIEGYSLVSCRFMLGDLHGNWVTLGPEASLKPLL